MNLVETILKSQREDRYNFPIRHPSRDIAKNTTPYYTSKYKLTNYEKQFICDPVLNLHFSDRMFHGLKRTVTVYRLPTRLPAKSALTLPVV